jgi:carbon-monoxide dehydrogenase medium subunit
MKPAPFDYVIARDVDHALETLAAAGGDAKILAGGQSLVPMMNFRLIKPAILVDINRIAGLDRVDADARGITLGALVRHCTTAGDGRVADRLPVLREAMRHVAHFTVRNRGTFVGSVCHADPAAEMPLIALLLNAEIRIVSRRGERRLPAQDFFLGALTTALDPDELVIAVDLPALAFGAGWGFEEFARRHGDYALAAVATIVTRQDGRARDVRIAVTGIGDVPVRGSDAEALLTGEAFTTDALDGAVEALRKAIAPNADLNASAEYRRHLVGVLARRALTTAWARAREMAL